MTLIETNGWEPLADHLAMLLRNGSELGDAIRTVAERPDSRVMFLLRAVQKVCGISSREAAKLVAREVTARQLP